MSPQNQERRVVIPTARQMYLATLHPDVRIQEELERAS